MAYTPYAERGGATKKKGYTPYAERVSTANLPPIDMGGFDTRVSASTPQSVSQGDPMAIPKTLAQIGGAVAVRAPLTAALSVEQGLRNRGILQKGKVQEIKGSEFGSLGETLLGDEPIRSLQEIVPEAQRGLASEGFGAFSLPIAFLGTAGAVGLDLLPIGTLRKAGVASLSKALTPKAAAVVVEKDFPKLWTELAKNKNVAEQFYATVAKETDLAKINTHVEDAARMLIPKKSYTPFAERSVAPTQKAGTSPSISKELEPLAEEARKYKSAEEFVKAQGEQVFRGGNKAFDKTLIGEDGVFVTPSKFMAETFGKNVDELYISPKAKVLSYNDLPKAIKDIDNWDDYSKAVSKYGREKGIDVIDSLPAKADYPRGMERTILNPDVIQTKSQLTDIYNQAVKTAPKTVVESPLAQEARKYVTPKGLYRDASFADVGKRTPEDLRTEIAIRAEQLDLMPGKELMKFVSPSTGQLPEVTGKATMQSITGSGKVIKNSKFGKAGDDIVSEILNNGGTLEDAQKAVDQYVAEREAIKELKSQLTATSREKSAGTLRTEQKLTSQTQLQTKTPQSQSVPPKASPSIVSPQEVKKTALAQTLPPSTYESNRVIHSAQTGRISRVADGLRAAWGSIGEGTDKILGTVSTRLKNIDPSLKTAIRNFEYKLGTSIQADRKAVSSFLEGIKGKNINRDDYIDLDLALKNGDLLKTQEIISKYGLEKEFAQVRVTLDDLYARAKEVGYDIGYEKNYFPRMIEDADGLLSYLGKGDDWSIIDAAIKAKETELGRYLTVSEKANLVNTLVRGYGGKITLSETGAMKARQIDVVDGNLNKFYRDSVASLIRYIDDTNNAIEARRFFGKGNKADEFANIKDSIGSYIFDLVAKGKVKPSQEKELRDILQARFGEIGTSGAVQAYKNLSYIDTMGSFTSAITQIGDLAFALYKGGPVQTVKALGKAIVGKSDITRADLGIEKIAQEFQDTSRSAQAVDRVFRIIGLHKMDALGKETLINATIGKYRKLAENPTTDFMRRIEAVFGNDTSKILDDLKSGKITEDVKLLAFNELLDVQPVALSEMPEQYLKGGNGRIFYMLKTYTIKLFDVYRNEIFQQMRTNPVQATKNLLYLSGALVAMNATADEIKDLMLNRETSLSDRTIDNVLKLAGFSKFTIYKAREEGIGSAVAKTILPPFKLLDAAYKDVTQGDFDETPQSIPVGGKLYYWWFGKGAEKTEKKRNPPSNNNGSAGLPKLPSLKSSLPPLPKLPSLE